MRFGLRFAFLCLIAVAATAPRGYAQASAINGEVTGIVTDPSGAVISGAAVTITSGATGFKQSVKTAESGLYLSSQRLRSYQSALQLSQGLPVVQLSELDEVPLPHLPIPVVELPTELWVLLMRLSHVAGYAREAESINMARERSRMAARRIAEYASSNRKVAVVAHGTINWLIGRNLKRQGWRVQKRGAVGGYWHWRLFGLPSLRAARASAGSACSGVSSACRATVRRPCFAACCPSRMVWPRNF